MQACGTWAPVHIFCHVFREVHAVPLALCSIQGQHASQQDNLLETGMISQQKEL